MKKENMIYVLKIEPGKLPYEKEIENSLSSLQKEVGGLIECVYLDDDCIVVCNDEGKINGMELNRRLGNDIIAGPFFIVGSSEDGEFISLSSEQIAKLAKEFEEIPTFTGQEPEAQAKIIFGKLDY